ncbi:hypothetical protein BGW38_008169 [Lunasporangiospora selenospora]|uniref:Dolichyldiphosphatase n=1 Tax=Lunasporangiospora selenospora TaxID=979761 RepID=A0A9P6KGJ9_9FUNG|nr:hypothetical protein BGW38_008169 [Lunasporangiospora selenospora]
MTNVLGDGYGMPSSHSQFMAFFATYLNLLIYRCFLRSTGMMEWMQDNDFGRWAFIRDVGQIDHAYRWEWEQFQQWRQTNQKS